MNWRSVLADIERVQRPKGRRQRGLYAIEGVRLVERALRADLPVSYVAISDRFRIESSQREADLLEALGHKGVEIFVLPDDEMGRLLNGRALGNCIALLPLPPKKELADVVAGELRPLLLTAVDIIDPGNVGAMVRTAHASGCHGVIAVGTTDPFHPKAVRTSMGSIFKMATVHYDDIDECLTDLKREGLTTVGTAVLNGRPLPTVSFPPKGIALLMGNEYIGLPEKLIEQLDSKISIPMAPGIDSYSINAATAIILYEITRTKDEG